VILPSLLLCDFGNLANEIRRVEAAGAPGLHLDVMDGHFVPNLTYGVPIISACRRISQLPLDVHLMMTNPHEFVEPFHEAGADCLTIHLEAVPEPGDLLRSIRQLGMATGIAVNPATPLDRLWEVLDLADLVLSMSVVPGFGGQKFQPVALEKLQQLRSKSDVLLEVDGGVNEQTIGRCAAAGANLFVVGSAIFGHPDYTARIRTLVQTARSGSSFQSTGV